MLGFSVNAVAANEYAITCIENRTNDRVYFDWHNAGEFAWRQGYIIANGVGGIYLRFQYPDQNAAPRLFINLDTDLSSNVYRQQFELERWASPSQDCNGAVHYVLEYEYGNRGALRFYKR